MFLIDIKLIYCCTKVEMKNARQIIDRMKVKNTMNNNLNKKLSNDYNNYENGTCKKTSNRQIKPMII